MQRRAAIVTALRTPVGRHGGALASVRPDDLGRPRHQGRRGAIRHRPRLDRGCLLRRHQPGRRGQPQRRAHGRAAGGPPGVRAGFDGESPLCVGAGSRQHRGAHDRGESRRCLHRGRRRVDEPCPLCAEQGGIRVRPVAADLRHFDRLAPGQSSPGGAASPLLHGRDRRECRPRAQDQPGGSGSVRAAEPATVVGGAPTRAVRRGDRARRDSAAQGRSDPRQRGRAPEAGHDAGESRQAETRLLPKTTRAR